MPLRHLIILLASVIAAAAITVFLLQGFITAGEGLVLAGIITGAMLIRVYVARR